MTSGGLAITCTINNSREHTLDFVRRFDGYANCRLFLFLDVPDHLSYFDGLDVEHYLTITVCDDTYWHSQIERLPEDMPTKQHTNIRRGAQLARELNFKWCLSIDSDELIYNLGELIPRLDELAGDADLLRMRPAELVHTAQTAFSEQAFGGYLFKRLKRRRQLKKIIPKLPLSLRWRYRKTRDLTERLFFGHTNGKTIFRLSAPVTVYKQHKQFSDERELVEIELPEQFLVLHYDAMNYSTWVHKWSRRISGYTRATAIGDERKAQTEAIARALADERGKAGRKLFRQWYVYSRRQIQKLKKAGLLLDISQTS